MLSPPSVQRPYDEYFSGDDALVQPPDGASSEDIEKHLEKVERARETSNWTELLIGGATPTTFHMRLLTGDQMRKIHSMQEEGVSMYVVAQLAFRCALTSITNLAGVKVTRANHSQLGSIASVDVTNALDAITSAIVTELGMLALIRGSAGLSPHR